MVDSGADGFFKLQKAKQSISLSCARGSGCHTKQFVAGLVTPFVKERNTPGGLDGRERAGLELILGHDMQYILILGPTTED